MGVVNSIQTLLLMPIIGLNQGVQPIVSYNFEQRNMTGSRVLPRAPFCSHNSCDDWFCNYKAVSCSAVSMFNRDEELLAFGKHAVKAWFMLLPVVGFQIIGSSFFQAIGRAKLPPHINKAGYPSSPRNYCFCKVIRPQRNTFTPLLSQTSSPLFLLSSGSVLESGTLQNCRIKHRIYI